MADAASVAFSAKHLLRPPGASQPANLCAVRSRERKRAVAGMSK
jgi:hypothetical protein